MCLLGTDQCLDFARTSWNSHPHASPANSCPIHAAQITNATLHVSFICTDKKYAFLYYYYYVQAYSAHAYFIQCNDESETNLNMLYISHNWGTSTEQWAASIFVHTAFLVFCHANSATTQYYHGPARENNGRPLAFKASFTTRQLYNTLCSLPIKCCSVTEYFIPFQRMYHLSMAAPEQQFYSGNTHCKTYDFGGHSSVT